MAHDSKVKKGKASGAKAEAKERTKGATKAAAKAATKAVARSRAPGQGASAAVEGAPGPLSNKEYEKVLRGLHVELVKLQEWVAAEG